MQIYETLIVLNANLERFIIDKEIEKYTNLFQQFSDTKKVYTKDIGQKKLAYSIKHIEYGYYVTFIYQDDNNQSIINMEREMQSDDHVLKYITITNEEKKLDDLIINHPQSEQIDAYDVLLGIAEY